MKSQRKCERCNKAFTDGTPVIAIERYTVNSKVDRGHGLIGYVHMSCPVNAQTVRPEVSSMFHTVD